MESEIEADQNRDLGKEKIHVFTYVLAYSTLSMM